MKTNLRQTKLTLLLGLLVLSGLTVYAYRASEQWRDHSAASAGQPTAILSHPRGRNAITTSIMLPITAGTGRETVAEPAQSGGSYTITQSVIAGGGGASSGGSYAETGLIGQSGVGASSGGQYSVEGGFLVGGQSGGCQTILVGPPTLPNGTVGVGYPAQTFTAGGGVAPYSFSVSIGNLPTGLNLVGDTLSGTPTAAGTFNFTVTATDNLGCQGFQVYAVTISGVPNSGLQFYPLAHPVRLLDTRAGQPGCDAPGAMIPGQSSRTQTAAGRTCDGLTIPANAKALTGNITTVQSGGGFLTL
ncbi:MAG TPA: Ig domain-containing protein, partial [Blastocatellia bacterium]|nr:Ig domain-containing protein [Blastocatellia bacterium]